jgi:hypothetical protein
MKRQMLLAALTIFTCGLFLFCCTSGSRSTSTTPLNDDDDDNDMSPAGDDDASPDDDNGNDDDDDDDASPKSDDDDDDNNDNDTLSDDDISPEWTTMSSGTTENLSAVWGSSATDVYAVGTDGSISHYDGSAWSPILHQPQYGFTGVWGSSASDVFAPGRANIMNGPCCIFHYDGVSWSQMAFPQNTCPGGAVWGASPSAVFIAGGAEATVGVFQYNGSTWSQLLIGAVTEGVGGTSASDVYVTATLDEDCGTIYHYDGQSWSSDSNYGVEYFYPGYVWAASAAAIWTAVFPDSQYPYYLVEIVGDNWVEIPTDNATNGNRLAAIWGASPSDIYAVGFRGTAIHGNGNAWQPMTTGTAVDLNGVWGSSISDVFAVGDNGTILHYTGAPPL